MNKPNTTLEPGASRRFPRWLWLLSALIVCNGLLWVLFTVRRFEGFRENGPAENGQLAALLLAMGLAGVAAWRQRGAARVWMLGLCVLLLNMSLREFEPVKAGLTGVLLWITDSTGRNLILLVLWLMWGGMVAVHVKNMWHGAWSLDRWGVGVLAAGGTVYAVGSLVDYVLVALPPEQQIFAQEYMECNAALLIAWASVRLCIVACRGQGSQTGEPSPAHVARPARHATQVGQ